MWLELLQRFPTVVDQSETCALATTILCSETKAGDLVFLGFVEAGKLFAQLVFGDVGAVGVEDVTLLSGV